MRVRMRMRMRLVVQARCALKVHVRLLDLRERSVDSSGGCFSGMLRCHISISKQKKSALLTCREPDTVLGVGTG